MKFTWGKINWICVNLCALKCTIIIIIINEWENQQLVCQLAIRFLRNILLQSPSSTQLTAAATTAYWFIYEHPKKLLLTLNYMYVEKFCYFILYSHLVVVPVLFCFRSPELEIVCILRNDKSKRKNKHNVKITTKMVESISMVYFK